MTDYAWHFTILQRIDIRRNNRIDGLLIAMFRMNLLFLSV